MTRTTFADLSIVKRAKTATSSRTSSLCRQGFTWTAPSCDTPGRAVDAAVTSHATVPLIETNPAIREWESRNMGYTHDIFVSYRRDEETLSWLHKHFVPLLKLRVRQELERDPTIYIDEQLESGVSWPPELGIRLGCSRILIALWAKDYFASIWCTEEMAQMLGREQECGFRTDHNPRGLVIPAVIHDGDEFPPCLSHIQKFEIQRLFNVRMARNSRRAEKLDATLAAQAPSMAAAINGAPPWRDKWPEEAAKAFREQLHTSPPSQDRLPRFATDWQRDS
jgi:TIR domain